MQKVREIPSLLLLLSLLCSCSASSLPDQIPVTLPDEDTARPKATERPHEGYMGDRADRVFHRIGCPRFKADPSRQMFFVNPFDALNDGSAPCTYCQPMRGW